MWVRGVPSKYKHTYDLINGEGYWVYGCDAERKTYTSHWETSNSPRAKVVRQSKSNAKVMLIDFFDTEGTVRAQFVPRGTSANSEYCKGLLERLRNDMWRKRPEKWKNGFVLHYDNVPCGNVSCLRQFLTDKKWSCVLNHYTRQIWHSVISGYTKKLN
jgi:hypothetical protein